MLNPIIKFYSFSGRSTRSEWWNWQIVGTLFYGLMWFLGQFLYPQVLVLWVPLLLIGFKALVVSVRRLHDMNMRAWWILLFLIPFVNFGLWLLLGLRESDREDNRYGFSNTGAIRRL